MPQSEDNASMEGKIGGQEFKYSGPINNLFTILGTVGVALLIYIGIQHDGSARDTTMAIKELSGEMRTATAVQRERNCLEKFKPEERQTPSNADWCKQISGVR